MTATPRTPRTDRLAPFPSISAAPGASDTALPLRQVRILVVDGDRHVRQSLTGLLRIAEEQPDVRAVADAAGALEALDSFGPDVVLMDPMLPSMDAGIRLLAQIRGAWPQVRVVAISCEDGCRVPALAHGAVAFVEKSGHPSRFLQEVLAAAQLTARPATI